MKTRDTVIRTPTGTMSDPTFIGFECDPDLKEAAREEARRDGRSLSSWMRKVVRDRLDIIDRVRERDDETEARLQPA